MRLDLRYAHPKHDDDLVRRIAQRNFNSVSDAGILARAVLDLRVDVSALQSELAHERTEYAETHALYMAASREVDRLEKVVEELQR